MAPTRAADAILKDATLKLDIEHLRKFPASNSRRQNWLVELYDALEASETHRASDARVLKTIATSLASLLRAGEDEDARLQRIQDTISGLLDGSILPDLEVLS